MRVLLPTPTGDLPIADAIDAFLAPPRPAPAGRPSVSTVMVASLDGLITIDGRSGGLGGDGDRALFRAMRARADIILVGAGTVRAEGYRPLALAAEVVAARRAAGRRADQPRLAIVTGQLDLDLDGELFAAAVPPVVVTHAAADAGRLAAFRDRTDVLVCGDAQVDLPAAVARLGEPGDVISCEGGPTLNGGLTDAGVLDELVLTIAPLTVGGTARRTIEGALPHVLRHDLAALAADDEGYLYARYQVSATTPPGAG